MVRADLHLLRRETVKWGFTSRSRRSQFFHSFIHSVGLLFFHSFGASSVTHSQSSSICMREAIFTIEANIISDIEHRREKCPGSTINGHFIGNVFLSPTENVCVCVDVCPEAN